MDGGSAAEGYSRAVDQAAAIFLHAAQSSEPPRDAMVGALSQVCRGAFDVSEGGQAMRSRALQLAEHVLVEHAVRRALIRLSSSAAEAGVPIMRWRSEGSNGRSEGSGDGSEATLPRLLQMSLDEPALEPNFGLVVLEVALETSTIEECGDLFAWMEAHLTNLTSRGLAAKTSSLRICNRLLRRLSKAQHTVLCGRISLFVARSVALDDRSGLNIQAAVNLSNTTSIEDPEQVTVDSNGEPVDVDFYRSFWGLQRAFQAPYATMAPAPWSSAVKTIQAALKRFKQEGFAVASSSLPSAGADGSSAAVKYLSSSKLLRLQLQDAGLRRHFLLQVLIFLHAVRHVGKQPLKAASPVLKDRQKDEADALEADAYEALEATPERGADFAAAVRAVLADETHWVRWKKDAVPDAAGKVMTCASFQRPPYRELATMQKGRGKRPGDCPKLPPSRRKRPRTDAEAVRIDDGPLDDLFNLARNNMDGLEVAERKHKPTVLEFMEPLIDQTTPGTVEEEYMIKRNPVYRWKCLRIVARQHMSTFARAAAANDVELAARELYPDKCAPKPEPGPEPAPLAQPVAAAEPEPAAESAAAPPQQNGKADMQPEVHAEDAADAADNGEGPAVVEPTAGAADAADAETPAA